MRRHQFCRVFHHDADSRACSAFPTNLGNHKMNVLYDLDSTSADLARDVLILAGWALVPTGQIDCLLAQLDGDTPVPCTYGLPRPDVAAAHHLPASAANAGFRTELPLCKRSGTITLRLTANLHDGARVPIGTRAIYLGYKSSAGQVPFEISRLEQFPEERPIFVIGMPRSGTTAMTQALHYGAQIPGYGEGHLFDVLDEMLRSLMQSWQRHLQQFAATDFIPGPAIAIGNYDIYTGINRLVASVHEVYHNRFQSNVWVDKTPGARAVRAVPLLHYIYPRARFLFMHRHPLKVALSMLQKYPELPLRQSFVEWAVCLKEWNTARAALSPDSFMEIAQSDLSMNTENVVDALKRLLQLDEQQAAGIARVLKTERPEYTGSSADSGDVYLEDVDWTEAEKETFRSFCLRGANELGYQTTRGERISVPIR